MRFHFIELADGRVRVQFKSSKEKVDLGTLGFRDDDGERPDIRELLLIILSEQTPMVVVDKA